MGALLEAERDCAEVGKKIFAMKNMFWLKKDSLAAHANKCHGHVSTPYP